MASQKYRSSKPVSAFMNVQSDDIGWDAVQRQLKEIDHGQTALESGELERGIFLKSTVIQNHWKPQETVSCCSNSKCQKKFGKLDRKKHCRMCGQVFCDACTSFTRKLSHNAQPHPDGQFYKVCEECFDQGRGPQEFGMYRSWTSSFSQVRREFRGRKSLADGMSLSQQLGVNEEMSRLLRGFGANASSWLMSTVTELRVVVPDWQRSPHWEDTKSVAVCRVCRSPFGLLATKHHCKVCGRVICKQCGADDLMMYLDDQSKKVSWALFGFEGCPQKEPSARLYLRCCYTCRSLLKQMKASELEEVDSSASQDMMSDIAKIHADLCQLQEKLEKQLPLFQGYVEAIENCRNDATPSGVSTVKQLAKAQMDVSDCLTRFSLHLNQKLCRMRPSNKLHATVLSRIAQCKMLFYRERLFLFRALKRCLLDTTPPEVLEVVQHTVELQAITSSYIFMRQLMLEIFNMTEVHGLDKELLDSFLQVDRTEVYSRDIRLAVERCCKIGLPEDCEKQMQCAQEMVRLRYKDGGRLMKLPASVPKSQSQSWTYYRCHEVVAQVQRDLEAKSSVHHFEASKEAVSMVKAQLETSVAQIPNSMIWRW